ncbi:MAG: S-methyl-5-thioribose-1-phosphate isomerase, partial [Acidimicrobiia bacterium]
MVPRRPPIESPVARDPIPPTVAWRAGRVRLIDQRALPTRLRYVSCETADELVTAIRDLVVRGAPALGVCGAFGVALVACASSSERTVVAAAGRLADARPTAVNLAWGVDQALVAYRRGGARDALACARELAAADVAGNRRLGALGAALLPDGARVLTHCNAGSLACVGYGTALGVIRAHHDAGGGTSVWVDETRPVGQGARLTAWELDRLGIPYRVVVDAAAASLFAAGDIDAVVVGADRIAANGDVANKIGTYGVAVLARAHGVPLYVAAPIS